MLNGFNLIRLVSSNQVLSNWVAYSRIGPITVLYKRSSLALGVPTWFNNFVISIICYYLFELLVLMLQGTTKDIWQMKNIDFYIQWYNRLSSFVATEICVVSPVICY